MSKFYYGGQAVMEGVMMRGRYSAAVAVRRPEGDIAIHEEVLNSQLYQNQLFRLPFLRGVLLLWEMLVLGTQMMTLSANIATGAVEVADAQDLPSVASATSEARAEDTEEERPAKLGGVSLALTLLFSLTFAIAIFFVSPLLLTSLLQHQIGTGVGSLIFEGVVRLLLLVGYLYLIGRIPDIQRVFGYHGAEHKAINTLEQGEPLDVAHVRQASRVHTRCGTGFLLIVMVVSILVFALVGSPSLLIKILSRIILVPVVAGIAYELMRFGASHYQYRVVRWLLAPGLALQGLTTREPDDSMIECAIASLNRVLAYDASEDHSQVPTIPLAKDESSEPSPVTK